MLRRCLALSLLGLAACVPAFAQLPTPIELNQTITDTVGGNHETKSYELDVTRGHHLYVVFKATDGASLTLDCNYGSLTRGDFVFTKDTVVRPDSVVEIPSTAEGLYYFTVESFSPDRGGSYELTLHDGWPWDYLTIGVPTAGSVGKNHDRHFYQMTVPAGLHLYISIKATDGASLTCDSYFGSLTRGDFAFTKDTVVTPEALVEIPKTLEGTYYFVLESFDPSQSGSYVINIQAANLPGDINRDGKLTVADVLQAIRFAVGIAQPTATQLTASDLNHNGKVDITDVIVILRKATGLA